jgi:hypothetical protein
MAVRLTTADLAQRAPRIIDLVAALVSDRAKIHVERFPNVGGYVVGVLPHGMSPALVRDPDELRVRTVQNGTFFNYHEVWVPVRATDKYDLNRAYLHFYIKRGVADAELQALSLHCDPALQATDASYLYRRGPHLHVGGADPSISRAHLSLCVGDTAMGGNNVGAMMTKFRRSIDMIAAEMLPCYA